MATPTTSNLNTIKYAHFVASSALKHALYLAEIFIFSFHLTHALTTDLTTLLVEQWVKPRPGGSYLMGRCINGKARTHFNKNTGLKSQARYPLYLSSGMKPFPPWQVLMHNQLQEHRHCHWGGKHAQQPAKKRGARLLMYNAITHMWTQKNMASGKKYKPYLSLNWLFFFLLNRNYSHSQVQPTSAVRASSVLTLHSSLVKFDVSFPFLLLRAPYYWDIPFLTVEQLQQLSTPCGHRSDLKNSSWGDSSHLTAVRFPLWVLTPQPSRPESFPLNILLKFWKTMQSDKMEYESTLSIEQFTRQYIRINASCTVGHAHIKYQPLLAGSFE